MLLRSRFQRFQHASGRRTVLRSFRSSRRSFQEHQRTRPPWRTSHRASHRSQARRGWGPIELESGRRGEHAARGRPAGLRQAREISHARSVAGIDDVGALLEHGGARMPTCMHACACVCACMCGWLCVRACRCVPACLAGCDGQLHAELPMYHVRHGRARACCAGLGPVLALALVRSWIYIDCTLLKHRGWLQRPPDDGYGKICFVVSFRVPESDMGRMSTAH